MDVSNGSFVEANTPSKVILFGEHAVLSGSPALAISMDLGTSCRSYPANDKEWVVNRRHISQWRDRYILSAVEILGGEPLHLSTRSRIPSAAGMGSSASITASAVASILGARDEFSKDRCMEIAHKAESMAEGRAASPLDTACVCKGGGIIVNPSESMGGERFTFTSKEQEWSLSNISIPDLDMVIGFSGTKGKTREVMENVNAFTTNQSSFYKEIMDDISKVSEEGIIALENGDLTQVGELMNKNHKLLATLGVNRPEIQTLIEATKRHSLGAKITGSGGGGCILALTEDVSETAEAISRVGGVPILARVDSRGVRVKNV